MAAFVYIRVALSDAHRKAPAVEGEGSEAHLAAYLWTLKGSSKDAIPPSGPGVSTTYLSLLDLPNQISYHIVIEQRMIPSATFPLLSR